MKPYYILAVLVLIACGNDSQKHHSAFNPSIKKINSPQEKLDSNLIKGVLALIQTQEHLKYPEIRLNESFIIIGFLLTHRYFSDSIINISYYYNNFSIDNNRSGYKGMLNLNGYNIAIFDSGDFGRNYYNIDSLRKIKLDIFTSYPMKNILIEQYYVRDRKINYFNTEIIVDQ